MQLFFKAAETVGAVIGGLIVLSAVAAVIGFGFYFGGIIASVLTDMIYIP